MGTQTVLHSKGLCIDTPHGRPLVRELNLSLGRERVALIGRNGVGKSSLLRVLAGEQTAVRGSVSAQVERVLVPQQLHADEIERARAWVCARVGLDRGVDRDLAELRLGEVPRAQSLSRGEARKLALIRARRVGAELILLDEPSEDLDEVGVAWLQRWLRREARGVMVVTHHRGLLRCFDEFFIVAESGCRHLSGDFDHLQRELATEQRERQQQYVRQLGILAEREQHNERVTRRRARKRNVGRLRELRRCTSRCRLNEKRSYAQESQARVARIRAQRIQAVRGWARASRRALSVQLPLALRIPALPAPDGLPIVQLDGVGMRVGDRSLFTGLDLQLGRERLAIVGPNGAGKTTLLQILLGRLRATSGRSDARIHKLGSIDQGASDWESDDSLLERLAHQAGLGQLARSTSSSPRGLASLATDANLAGDASLDALAQRVVAHAFPLALAERPLRSLSPGERVRAALICLFQQAPEIELLVLDEPSFALDFVGVAALERALRDWPGGLIVVSHDRELLDDIGIDRWLELDGEGGHTWR